MYILYFYKGVLYIFTYFFDFLCREYVFILFRKGVRVHTNFRTLMYVDVCMYAERNYTWQRSI